MLSESTPPSKNITLFNKCLCANPSLRILPLPEYTPLFNNYMRPSQNLSLPSRYNLFSTNVYVRPPPPPSQNLPLPPRICPPFNNYLRSSQNLPLPPRYNIFSANVYVRPPLTESTPLSKNMPPFQQLYAILPESTPPSRNIYTPPFQQYPPFQQLYATLPESTLPSQNIPPFSTNVYLRPSKNLLVPPRIYPPPPFRHLYTILSGNVK